ncbi:MAG TPA: ATP-binding protein [Chthoniobacterales bacterium]|nr:ATP-binding protein [Chthoniobacterales bacterium]
MAWLLFTAIVGSTIVLAYVVWRKWIAPWHEIETLVRQVGRGEQPRTFLVAGGREAERVGAALESILTRQRTLDRQLADYRSGQKAVFAAMQDGLLVVDGERRIALLNRTFTHWFGVPENSLGAPLIETVRDPAIERLVDLTFQKREAVQREITIAERHLQMNGVPLGNKNGELNGAVILFHDITELKRLDEMRRDFVANVSHELRTPLSILRGYIETLLDSGQTSRDELRRILSVMERHSKRLGLLLDDLLRLAKLESADPNLELSSVRLDELCLNVARDWEKKLAAHNLRVLVDLAPGLPAVDADAPRLQEVLYNLLDNAVKYSPRGGEIRLRVEPRGEEIALSVTDNGIGISKEDLPRIFERFYRAEKSRGGDNGGTGLGLAIVKHIAQLHGGRVEAESEPGKGTTIRVILPAPL